MNYFLVDYENVNLAGFNGIAALDENSTEIIFYSANADSMTFGLHRRINESKAKFQFQKVSVGEKNALDFQLCSYLGFLIRDTAPVDETAEKSDYYIVSNDHGYAVLSEYWKRRGFNVMMVENLAKNPVKIVNEIKPTSPTTPPKPPKSDNKNFENKLAAALPGKVDVSEVMKIIKRCHTKQEIHNELNKKFTSQKDGTIYKAIKSLLKDKK